MQIIHSGLMGIENHFLLDTFSPFKQMNQRYAEPESWWWNILTSDPWERGKGAETEERWNPDIIKHFQIDRFKLLNTLCIGSCSRVEQFCWALRWMMTRGIFVLYPRSPSWDPSWLFEGNSSDEANRACSSYSHKRIIYSEHEFK